MLPLDTALNDLLNQLSSTLPDAPGLRVFESSFALNDSFDALTWLSSQSAYPQFYWQQRSGSKEAAVLGKAVAFTSLEDAQKFIRQYPDEDLRVWGLNEFDPSRSSLILPRLEWRRNGEDAALRLTLFSENSLRSDSEFAKAYIAALKCAKPLPPLQSKMIREEHRPDKEEWCRLIKLATDTISNGKLNKTVLARATDLHFEKPINPASMLNESRKQNLHCYHFYMAFDPDSAFLGSSPERLWRRIGKSLQTEALAGTVANHNDDQEALRLGRWLMSDDKNQRENMLVVKDICQRLEAECEKLEVLPEHILRLRKVQHLCRQIQTSLHKADDTICLYQLQPTAAVAGLPRNAAREFIAEYEPFTREWYAGSAGYLSLKQSEFCVSLRSAKISGNVVRLYAGAGIVPGSDPEAEWIEINNKAAGLKTLLQPEHK